MSMIERFLGGYSGNFALALGLWPVMSFVLTLPILAYLYHRDGRIKALSALATYLSVLYALSILCFTLYPLPQGDSGLGITRGVPWQLDPLAFVGDFLREGPRVIPQIAFNVVFFVPLGFIAGRFLRMRALPSILLGFAVSFFVEAAQGTGLFGIYRFAYRTADVNDLMWNTSGAAIGWLAAAALSRVFPPGALAEEGSFTDEPGFIRRCVAFWLDMLLAGLAFLVIVTLAQLIGEGAERILYVSVGAPWGFEVSALAAVLFVAVEGVVPWLRQGRTFGGGFVRMTCETRPRSGARRAAFYIARLCVLGFCTVYLPLIWPVVGLFFLIARRMPYDFI